jgi:hypothetical protein
MGYFARFLSKHIFSSPNFLVALALPTLCAIPPQSHSPLFAAAMQSRHHHTRCTHFFLGVKHLRITLYYSVYVGSKAIIDPSLSLQVHHLNEANQLTQSKDEATVVVGQLTW